MIDLRLQRCGKWAAIAWAAIFLQNAAQAAETGGSVHLRGSGTVMSIIQPLAESYMQAHPGIRIVVSGGGSWWGMKSVADGTADIGMTSWGSEPDDLDDLVKEKKIPLARTVLARDAVIPIVNPTNPVRNLTMGELRELFKGVAANWQAVGGANETVQVGSGNPHSGTFELWSDKVLGSGAVITPQARVLRNDELQSFIAQNKGAIAYTGLGRVIEGVAPVSVNGVAASPATIHDGRYPILRDLTLLYREDAPQQVKDFVAYCSSADAVAVIRRFNAVPMAPTPSAPEAAQ